MDEKQKVQESVIHSVLELYGLADKAVCLMDMPDDWDMEFQVERYKETFDRAIAFAAAYPDTLWCHGNHDVSYPCVNHKSRLWIPCLKMIPAYCTPLRRLARL